MDLDLTVSQPTDFTLRLRIPSFAQGRPLPSALYRYADDLRSAPTLTVDGSELPLKIRAGYTEIARRWEGQTRINLHLPLPIRRVSAHPAATDLTGLVALERGPLVYALETADNAASVLGLALPADSPLTAQRQPDLLGGITSIHGTALDSTGKSVPFTAIPYYAWGHRGPGEMTVWLRQA